MKGRTLEQGRYTNDDLHRISEGRVEQARERLAELERELLCGSPEQLYGHIRDRVRQGKPQSDSR